jgi:hypothetical protein
MCMRHLKIRDCALRYAAVWLVRDARPRLLISFISEADDGCLLGW